MKIRQQHRRLSLYFAFKFTYIVHVPLRYEIERKPQSSYRRPRNSTRNYAALENRISGWIGDTGDRLIQPKISVKVWTPSFGAMQPIYLRARLHLGIATSLPYRSEIKCMCLILYCYIQHLWLRHRWGIALWAIQERRRCDSGVAVAVCKWALRAKFQHVWTSLDGRTSNTDYTPKYKTPAPFIRYCKVGNKNRFNSSNSTYNHRWLVLCSYHLCQRWVPPHEWHPRVHL